MLPKSLWNESTYRFPRSRKRQGWPLLACRSRPGWNDGKTAPTEAIESILGRGREGNLEILASYQLSLKGGNETNYVITQRLESKSFGGGNPV
jgi:hypothetical protein